VGTRQPTATVMIQTKHNTQRGLRNVGTAGSWWNHTGRVCTLPCIWY